MNDETQTEKDNQEALKAEADYEVPCDVCGNTPTVMLVSKSGAIDHLGLCGACTWGESECIDPDNW